MNKSCQYNLGLVGRKLGHSFSARFFNEKFRREGISGSYELFELASIEDLPGLLDANPDLCGFNVTTPYKEEILPYIDILSPEAAEANAVNTVKIEYTPDGQRILKGYNTDIDGFIYAIDLFAPRLKGNAALICGTGGAARAVGVALRRMGVTPIFASRSEGKSILGDRSVSYRSVNDSLLGNVALIVNATPLGMYPNVDAAPPLEYDIIDSWQVGFDLTYNPAVTKFMSEMCTRGCAVRNGLEMLRSQARGAWRIWSED